MWVFSCVSLSHLLEFLPSRNISLQSCTDYRTPLPPSHLLQPYWPTPCYWDFSLPTLFPIQLPIGTTHFLLDYCPQKTGPTGCPATQVRNYRYLLHNNPEDCTSHLHKNHLPRSHTSVSFKIFQAAVIQMKDIFQACIPCSELCVLQVAPGFRTCPIPTSSIHSSEWPNSLKPAYITDMYSSTQTLQNPPEPNQTPWRWHWTMRTLSHSSGLDFHTIQHRHQPTLATVEVCMQ
jgi:hypothetical protein